ncbi:short-chain dehydrogenase/reductase [Campylobacter iguaniorum]|uniref:Short-chain dehydrogenase/reductase n=1 Tax=Campylobacter iguaniorum TaxID=1244531 RepID=A0A076FDM9_9BACT|nr:SDR family oxidoreductase [Campylobacter iguaniorum]AII13914.1 short-chain dehydrogenase/reductase [Campylobacter iguaniorum]
MDLIIVTGSSKGLGFSICKRLLESNYMVVGIARTKSEEFLNLQKAYPKELFYKEYDFNNTANIQLLVREITKEYGNIYGLINNAALGYDGILGTMHESQISELIRVNIEAPIILTKYVSRSMIMKFRGRIINIGSIIGNTGFNGLSVYGATKASMQGFTRSLARELGKANITVNTIAPGYMQTAMTSKLQGQKLESIKRRSPLGHLVTVDDVAGSVLFLLSDDAKNITGTIITVDAGSVS